MEKFITSGCGSLFACVVGIRSVWRYCYDRSSGGVWFTTRVLTMDHEATQRFRSQHVFLLNLCLSIVVRGTRSLLVPMSAPPSHHPILTLSMSRGLRVGLHDIGLQCHSTISSMCFSTNTFFNTPMSYNTLNLICRGIVYMYHQPDRNHTPLVTYSIGKNLYTIKEEE